MLEHLGACGNLQSPAAVFARTESGQFLAAGDDDLRPGGGFVGDGPPLIAGILLVEGDGFGDAIGTRREDHADGFGERAREFTDGQSGAFERGQGSVGFTAGTVVALGGDIEIQCLCC